KKKGDVPIEEVQRMSAQGMSDKDIIKKLKSEGYSYDSIEKSMLQAVKEGVSEPEPSSAEAFSPSFPESMAQPKRGEAEALFPEFEPQEMPEIENINPEIVIEELVEGVVEEKWNKFSSRMEKIENELNLIRTELKQPRQVQQGSTKEAEAKVAELAEQLDELDARIGGLEKAFKQFLPSLTRNIEALSRMIHEMKEKHGMQDIPEERLLS
ncbi:MAG: hypothetical protein AABX69_00840, partial [Nanoarchaeota archaeon]